MNAVSPWRTSSSFGIASHSSSRASGHPHRYDGRVELGLGGRGCLVTGGTAGIGLATAQALAPCGCARCRGRHVTPSGPRQSRTELQGLGARDAFGIASDLSTAAGCRGRPVGHRERALRGLDVLVNNVGSARTANWWEVDDTGLDALVRAQRARVRALHPRRALAPARVQSGARRQRGLDVGQAAVDRHARLQRHQGRRALLLAPAGRCARARGNPRQRRLPGPHADAPRGSPLVGWPTRTPSAPAAIARPRSPPPARDGRSAAWRSPRRSRAWSHFCARPARPT